MGVVRVRSATLDVILCRLPAEGERERRVRGWVTGRAADTREEGGGREAYKFPVRIETQSLERLPFFCVSPTPFRE